MSSWMEEKRSHNHQEAYHDVIKTSVGRLDDIKTTVAAHDTNVEAFCEQVGRVVAVAHTSQRERDALRRELYALRAKRRRTIEEIDKELDRVDQQMRSRENRIRMLRKQLYQKHTIQYRALQPENSKPAWGQVLQYVGTVERFAVLPYVSKWMYQACRHDVPLPHEIVVPHLCFPGYALAAQRALTAVLSRAPETHLKVVDLQEQLDRPSDPEPDERGMVAQMRDATFGMPISLRTVSKSHEYWYGQHSGTEGYLAAMAVQLRRLGKAQHLTFLRLPMRMDDFVHCSAMQYWHKTFADPTYVQMTRPHDFDRIEHVQRHLIWNGSPVYQEPDIFKEGVLDIGRHTAEKASMLLVEDQYLSQERSAVIMRDCDIRRFDPLINATIVVYVPSRHYNWGVPKDTTTEEGAFRTIFHFSPAQQYAVMLSSAARTARRQAEEDAHFRLHGLFPTDDVPREVTDVLDKLRMHGEPSMQKNPHFTVYGRDKERLRQFIASFEDEVRSVGAKAAMTAIGKGVTRGLETPDFLIRKWRSLLGEN